MSASAVNVKVAYIRPKYKNLEDWMKDTNNVYTARKGVVFIDKVRFPKSDSLWANPYKITAKNTLKQVLTQYEEYIRDKIAKGEITKEQLSELKGKKLGCWCVEKETEYDPDRTKWVCHTQVLLQLLKEID